jgi:hypothetical protein
MEELPETLDDTYEKVLNRIPEQFHEEVQIVFNLVAFCFGTISLPPSEQKRGYGNDMKCS